MPPRSPPLPGPALVTKKVMLGACGACCACKLPLKLSDMSAADANTDKRIVLYIVVLPSMIWLHWGR